MATINKSMPSNPDWASLLPELLYLITRKLFDFPDFINFRAVCRSWRFSASISDSDLPPQKGPWVIEQHTNYPLPAHFRFFSLSTGNVFTRAIPPQLEGATWSGHALDGYLLLVGPYPHKELSLFNPLTDHHVHIPLIINNSRLPYDWKFFWRSGNYVIVSIKGSDSSRLAFFKLDDQKWNIIEADDEGWSTCICSNGMFFTYDWFTCDTRIVDIATGNLISVVPSPIEDTDGVINGFIVCLAESFGDILMVFTLDGIDCDVSIYKLKVDFDNEHNSYYWVRTDSIGDCVLFICGGTGFSFNTGQYHVSINNCNHFRKFPSDYGSTIFRYSIEDGEMEEICCPFEKEYVFVPSLQYLNNSGSE